MQLFVGTDPEVGCVYRRTGTWRNLTTIFADEHKTSAIGLDGQRATASLEYRPGVQLSSEVLVHRLAELVEITRDHYHPPVIAYRCGAWVCDEPLGGHVHFSWDKPEVDETQLRRLVLGLNATHYRLVHEMFLAEQLETRYNYAMRHDKDYARLGVFRALPHQRGTYDMAVAQKHIEYRYPPSWMLTPEMAYTFLASAETVARAVLFDNYKADWRKLTEAVLDHGTLLPEPGAPSIVQAYQIAKRNLRWNDDFTDNWTE